MTDKKLTDEEIIKALECCAKSKTNVDCVTLNCPCFKDGMCIFVDDDLGLQNYALDLINRQKSEIERLKERPKCVYEYDGEVTEYCVQGPCQNFKTVEQIKAEAYKEFAEKLKQHIDIGHLIPPSEGICFSIVGVIKIVDEVLKQMVGEEE